MVVVVYLGVYKDTPSERVSKPRLLRTLFVRDGSGLLSDMSVGEYECVQKLSVLPLLLSFSRILCSLKLNS